MRIPNVAPGIALVIGLTVAMPAFAQADSSTAPTASYITNRPVADARDCIGTVLMAVASDGQHVHSMAESARPVLWVTNQSALLASVHIDETSDGTRVDYRAERQPQAQHFEKALLTCK